MKRFFKKYSNLLTIACAGTMLFTSCKDQLEGEEIVEIVNENKVAVLESDVFTIENRAKLISVNEWVSFNGDAPVTVQFNHQPQFGQIELLEDGYVVYIPDSTFKDGEDLVIFDVVDAANTVIDQDTIVISMVSSAELPCDAGAISDVFTGYVGEQIIADVLANDKFCDAHTGQPKIDIITLPEYGSVVVEDNVIQYFANTTFLGTDELMYSVTFNGDSSQAHRALAQFVLENRQDTVRGPVSRLVHDTYEVYNNNAYNTFNLFENDSIVEGVSLIILDAPQNGAVYELDEVGHVAYVPHEGFVGTDEFVYSVTCDDPDGNCPTATVTIEVMNDPAVPLPTDSCQVLARDDFYQIEHFIAADSSNFEFTFYVVENDEHCDQSISMKIIDQPERGRAEVSIPSASSAPLLVYKRTEVYFGTESIEYEICDQDGNCDRASVMIVFE